MELRSDSTFEAEAPRRIELGWLLAGELSPVEKGAIRAAREAFRKTLEKLSSVPPVLGETEMTRWRERIAEAIDDYHRAALATVNRDA